MAKADGAEVTGVDLRGKLERLRTLGADHVLEYTQQDFSRTGVQYDLILEVACPYSIFDYQRVLGPSPQASLSQSFLENSSIKFVLRDSFAGYWNCRIPPKERTSMPWDSAIACIDPSVWQSHPQFG